jgi:osmotically-inducible protein OsmY
LKNLKQCYVLATVLILSGLLLGCAVERKCEAGGCPGDAKITANVQLRINQHPDVGPPDSIHVLTLDQVVYLSGEVSQGLMKQTAEDVARQTPGVTRVVNNISVEK